MWGWAGIGTLLCLVGHLACGQEPSHHYLTVPHANLCIEVTTNVNTFSCQYTGGLPGGLSVQSMANDRSVSFEHLGLKFPVRFFSCQVPGMDDDFRDLLKASAFPDLILYINQIQVLPGNQSVDSLKVLADLTLVVAGNARKLSLQDGHIYHTSMATLALQGVQVIDMRDFGIEPPVKFMGLVKVQPELKVSFSLLLAEH